MKHLFDFRIIVINLDDTAMSSILELKIMLSSSLQVNVILTVLHYLHIFLEAVNSQVVVLFTSNINSHSGETILC